MSGTCTQKIQEAISNHPLGRLQEGSLTSEGFAKHEEINLPVFEPMVRKMHYLLPHVCKQGEGGEMHKGMRKNGEGIRVRGVRERERREREEREVDMISILVACFILILYCAQEKKQ